MLFFSTLTLPRGLAQFGLLPLAKLVRSDGQEADVALRVALTILALVQQVFWDRRYLDHLMSKTRKGQTQ